MPFNPQNHRRLFNADANVWMYKYRPQCAFYRAEGQPLTAADIHRYVDIVADAGIDTFLINPSCQVAWYPSKTVPTILDNYRRGDRSFFFGHILGWDMTPAQIETYLDESAFLLDGYLDLADAGVNWLTETLAACRRRGMSPWVSVRMNDMHGATKLIEASYMNSDLFKDPAMRLRGTTFNPQAPVQNGWQGFNYEKPEVREFVLENIRDLVENYDCEGLELDWSRWPLCCEPDASDATAAAITEWHADVREMTERQAAKTGRPFTVGIKYVGTLDQMRSIGLDLRAMAHGGLIDWAAPTNSWQTSWDIPSDELRRELGPDVALYGVLEMAPNWLHGFLPQQTKGNTSIGSDLAINYRLSPCCPPMLHGNAAAKLVLGFDGIEIYNYPPADQTSHWPFEGDGCKADYNALHRIDDLESLRGKPKLYTFASQHGYYQHELFERFGPFPTVLGAAEKVAGRVPMCAETDSGMELVIQVIIEKQEKIPPLGIHWNGAWPRFDGTPDDRLLFPVASMTHHTPDHTALNFTFPVSAIREGWNEIVVMNGAAKDWSIKGQQDAVTIHSVELGVRTKPSS